MEYCDFLLESGTKNIEIGDRFEHSERYNISEEYLEVCYKLWEGSWDDDAVVRDRENRVFTDPTKVHEINHHGKYFDVPGIHLCEPSPQRTPVLHQVGGSTRGRQFAATHAECTFIAAPGKEAISLYVRDLRAQATLQGRDPQSLKVLFYYLQQLWGKQKKKRWAKYEELYQHISVMKVLFP